MEAKAQTRYLRVTAQKARRVVNLVRGQNAVEAAASLKFQPQAVAEDVRKAHRIGDRQRAGQGRRCW
ncbi:hypothetical protein GCM10025876_24330 [Demequina litorisediminis]|uniref:50S ribosomal protein L22 n=1 Tax=Demequina litorisediminis TaxID=1849022 RepID=A0ABQ6IET1_9MICO|nr:hypothetical protein GCM10025876_24330 [Demequina litorisediminis]